MLRVIQWATGNVGRHAAAIHHHAIAPVCAAEHGIRTFLDLPMITGRRVLG